MIYDDIDMDDFKTYARKKKEQWDTALLKYDLPLKFIYKMTIDHGVNKRK